MNDPYEDQLKAARYKAERDQARQRIAGLMKSVDDLDDENERLRDMLNDIAWKLGIGREVHYLSGDNYDECHKRVLGEISKLSSPTSYDVAQVTASAYDLLPEEDRKAMRWVRENEGLLHVQTKCYLADETARTVTGRAHGKSTPNDIIAELRKRLMPEGMEWPRYEDSGEFVRLGEYIADSEGSSLGEPVVSIEFFTNTFMLNGCTGQAFYRYEERVKRPAFLAADGKPLEVGQTVWDANGDEFRVLDVYGGPVDEDFPDHTVRCRRAGAEDYESTMCEPSQLTHQRPVLDADGAPIELGDDLYSVEGSLKLHVSNIDRVRCKIATSEMFALDRWADPSMFTHTKPEPPDSWERIEGDLGDEMAKQQCGPISPELACKLAGEFVRRFKALAGVTE